jgi:hypothetical protein
MSYVSKALRDSAGHPDARCMLNIAGVCPDETTSKTAGNVLCHLRFAGNAGGGQKPDDFCATFGCGPCHRVMDSNGTAHGLRRGSEEWLFYALRGQHRTLRWWFENGFLQEAA